MDGRAKGVNATRRDGVNHAAHLILLLVPTLLLAHCSRDDPKAPPECTTNADCRPGWTCEGGTCHESRTEPECRADDDCGSGMECRGGRCGPSTDAETAAALECVTDLDCPAERTCVGGSCVSRPDCDLGAVYFDFDAYSLRPDARQILQTNADCLKRRPDYQVRIEGHCDERGTEEYNLSLGENRARAVRDHLRDLGVDASAMETISFGEGRPAATGSGELVWSRNRRGEILRRSSHRASAD